jgi:serine protease Do
MPHRLPKLIVLVTAAFAVAMAHAQNDPASEPAVIAVGRTMPAVVNINTERIVQRSVRDPYDELFNQFFGGPMRRPRIYSQKVLSLGSGFIVDPSGYIVTNEHVVQRAAELKISVTTNDGKTYSARYIAGAEQADLAFLKIDSKEPLPFISPTDLSPNLLGQTVLVLGNPLGYGSSVARGILSAKNRTVAVENVEYKNLIQTDAAINPGNSGGPVVDINGKLVGISSVKMAYTPQGVPTQGLGFAIPGETVREKVAEFKKIASEKKTAAPKDIVESRARKLFGLQLQDLTEKLAESFGVDAGAGVLIADVDPKTPGDIAGMKRGLVIYHVGRYQVTSAQQVEDLLNTVNAGAPVDFTVGVPRRAGGRNVRQLQTVQLTAQ